MDGHVAEMVARRKEAIALRAAARAAHDERLVIEYDKIIRQWDVMLARHGVGPQK